MTQDKRKEFADLLEKCIPYRIPEACLQQIVLWACNAEVGDTLSAEPAGLFYIVQFADLAPNQQITVEKKYVCNSATDIHGVLDPDDDDDDEAAEPQAKKSRKVSDDDDEGASWDDGT